ncbi:MAG: phosphocholine cytidylyltransferase family protein [Xanthomonadales bacterium]|nr:phosphocholine cytidylyltransferase family protein [Xanthomonadales bacterium]
MKAIILAAGRGSRMQGLTDNKPKGLVEFRGKHLLDWQLAALRAAHISEIAIVTGYRRELFASWKLKEFHNSRWQETNMVSSLECASDWLKFEPCIVSYSDIFYESSAVTTLINASADLAITYDENWRSLWESRFGDPLSDAETFRLDTEDGTLLEIGNKPKTIDEIEGQYMGLLRFTPKGWDEVVKIRAALAREICDQMHMTGTLQKIIKEGRVPVTALPYRGNWGEVDSEKDLLAYD